MAPGRFDALWGFIMYLMACPHSPNRKHNPPLIKGLPDPGRLVSDFSTYS
jgi:hypothetical protein